MLMNGLDPLFKVFPYFKKGFSSGIVAVAKTEKVATTRRVLISDSNIIRLII